MGIVVDRVSSLLLNLHLMIAALRKFSFFRLVRLLSAIVAVIAIQNSSTVAQRREASVLQVEAGDLIRGDARTWFEPELARGDGPILIETSAPVVNLLSRAEDAIARRDWKLAIDSLQRVLDDRAGTLVPRHDGAGDGGRLYESARRFAMRRLASLPPEGLLGYRILFDGKAKGLFDRAKANRNEVDLRVIVDRFLLTRFGDDASDLLASLAIDQGQPAKAAALLNDVLELTPDHGVAPERIYGKLALAYLLMGETTQGRLSIASATNRDGTPLEPPDWLSSRLAPGFSDDWVESARQLVAARQKGSGGSRAGQAGPPVEPTLLEHLPWRHELTGSTSELWRRIKSDDGGGSNPPIPRPDLVTDGRRFYVRTANGCAALESGELDAAWSVTADRALGFSIRPALGGTRPSMARWTESFGPYSDDPSNAVSTALGLVFVIERTGVGEFADRDETAGQRLLFLRQPLQTFQGFRKATRLVALDAETGKIRWHRGRTDNARDILGDVQFLSTPIEANGRLWVPYLQGSDLYVGVLGPTDGAVVQTIHLGSAQEIPDVGEPLTPPTLADGAVYIPTGFGAVYSVDVDQRATRWAFVYETRLNPGRRTHPGMMRFWIAAPPVVTGGTVLVTPTDSPEMIALNSNSGELEWSRSVEGCNYMIGADQGHVWLGGRRITCLQMTDGAPLWTTHLVGVPTGKAAICGDRIQVPTADGLITLDALSGELIHQVRIPDGQPPLGNLTCMGTALFSLDPSSIRRFPDIQRMRESATAALSRDQADKRAAVALAWAELLSDRPDQALEALDRLSGATSSSRDASSVSESRVRIEALFALANRSDSPTDSLRLLELADKAAVESSTRLRCRTEIASQLVAVGRVEEAYQELLDVGSEDFAGELTSGSEGVSTCAREKIRRLLADWRSQLEPAQMRKIEATLSNRIASLIEQLRSDSGSRNARDTLLALVDLQPASAASQQILSAIADWEISLGQQERAEQRLRHSVRIDADRHQTAAALMRLCEMYADPALGAIGLLSECLIELSTRLGEETIPREIIQGAVTSALPSGGRINDWVLEMRRRSSDAKLFAIESMSGRPTSGEATFSLGGGYAWTFDAGDFSEGARLVQFGDNHPRVMVDRILVMSRTGQVECIGADQKELLWQSQLRPAGAFSEVFASPNQRGQSLARYGVVDGQIAALTGPEGIFGVGVLTGRLLWAIPFDAPVTELGGHVARDRLMAAHDGQLVAMPREDRITLLRMADGSTVWERELRGESVARVWMNERSIVTADSDHKRVHVLNRGDGSIIQRILFRQPDPDHERIDLVLSDGMLYGPETTESGDAVGAYDLRTGEKRWSEPATKPIVALFVPQSGYLGVGLLGGDLKVIDTSTGRLVLERSDPSVRAIIGGVMWDGTLVLRGTGLHGSRQANVLAAFDIATGEEVWRRRGITTLLSGDAPLTVIAGVIPALVEQVQTEVTKGGVATPRGSAAAALIDVRTGNDSGRSVDLSAATQGFALNGDLAFLPNVLAVGTIKGIQGIRVDATRRTRGSGL